MVWVLSTDAKFVLTMSIWEGKAFAPASCLILDLLVQEKL